MREIVAAEGPASQASRIGYPCAIETAFRLGRRDEAADLLALLADRPPGHVPPFLRAQLDRGRGLLALQEDDTAAACAHFAGAVDAFTALGYPFWLANLQTDLAAAKIAQGRQDEARALLAEAVATLRELGAAPALGRAESLLAGR
jgi:hypothetical protein